MTGVPASPSDFFAALRAYLPEQDLDTLDELGQRKCLQVVIAGGYGQDPDGVGVKPWWVAMYAASSTPTAALGFLAGFV